MRSALLFTLILAACGSGGGERPAPAPEEGAPPPVEAEPEAPTTPADPLLTATDGVSFAENPALRERLLQSPHNYFRFTASAFNAAVCEIFEDLQDEMPPVNLHGDAHLEQYAVTDLGRGLTDYDLSTSGPAVIDLVRVGASLHLACQGTGFQAQDRALYDRFLEGYREGLTWTEGDVPPEPPMVRRIREGFDRTQSDLLAEVERLMIPLPEDEETRIRASIARYAALQVRLDPTLREDFFDVVRVGRLRMGIGSALDVKYVVRIAGATDAPEDDQVLEAKAVRTLEGVPCIRGGGAVDPFRVLLGLSRIAYEPFPWLGYARDGDTTFWLHGWTPNYVEIDVETEFQDAATLEAIVRDIGVQLGRGHVNQIADPLGAQLRQAQLAFLTVHRDRLEEARTSLADRVRAGWRRFRELESSSPSPPSE